MRNDRSPSFTGAIVAVAWSLLGLFTPAASADPASPRADEAGAPPERPAQELPEVLSRGPVHEAFAEPVSLQLQAGLIAPERPPPNIAEVPPEERPQGQQFVWIPGYWSWDADRRGYIWVSACWRVAPPRMSWVPGYWSQVSGGWEWVAGFWAPADAREIEYLPAPPAVEDVEPYGAAPSPDTIWVPPCMYWDQGQYVRRSGYWLGAQQDWVWVPSHYVVTPRGYIFAEGHWDYALERRGVLFAPVYFPAGVYARAGFEYSPSIVIDMGLLRLSLFAYPRYSHYYFGDYYDDAYLRIGIYPWFDSRRLRSWYDPVYEHDRWRHQRSEPRWEERERNDYNRRCADRSLRPARTFREQESRLAKLPEPQRRALQVTQPIRAIAAGRDTPFKYERISTDARQKISKQATAVHAFRDERNHWEAASAAPRTISQPKDRRVDAPAPAERRETAPTPKDRRVDTPAPAERRETAPTPKDRRGDAPAPAERRETAPTPKDRRVDAPAPAERRETAPTPKERRVDTPAPVKRSESAQMPRERKVEAPPAAERAQAVQQPKEERARPPTAPVAQRDTSFGPSRESRVIQPERVHIPDPPIVGRSGRRGIFQGGPPAQPANEGKDKEGRDKEGRDNRRR